MEVWNGPYFLIWMNGASLGPYCCCSVAKLFLTLCDPVGFSTPGSSVLLYLPEFAEVHVHWIGDAIQPSHPLPPHLPSIFSSIRVFSNESGFRIMWPKYWCFLSINLEFSPLKCLSRPWLWGVSLSLWPILRLCFHNLVPLRVGTSAHHLQAAYMPRLCWTQMTRDFHFLLSLWALAQHNHSDQLALW